MHGMNKTKLTCSNFVICMPSCLPYTLSKHFHSSCAWNAVPPAYSMQVTAGQGFLHSLPLPSFESILQVCVQNYIMHVTFLTHIIVFFNIQIVQQ